ncbi:hypothetical protein [Mesorhizobium sp. M0895]|uniref:hypothetical protein n=1 Tax=Mesorhizobium sp. M0895 TaxID=2957019 RepID=UPI00333A3B7E
MPSVFPGPRIKVERAYRHISELEAELRQFRERKPYHVFIEHDASAGMNHICYEVRETIPASWGAIIGDAIHNLRSALDLLVNDLVAMHGVVKRGHARFPIFADDAAWTSSIKRIKGVSPAVQDTLQRLQPYKTGNRSLRDMHEIDIADKHQLLVPAVTAAAVRDISARMASGGQMAIGEMKLDRAETGIHRQGSSWPSEWHMEGNDKFNVSIDILFGDIDTLPRTPVLPSLNRLAKAVASVIDGFEPQPISSPAQITI